MTKPPLPHFQLVSLATPIETYVGHITGISREDHYDLEAPYQRGAVWSLEQKRNLIQSIIRGLPIGTVIIAKLPYSVDKLCRVVDGQQRIRALRAFTANEFTVPGWWFPTDHLTDPEARRVDVTYADLTVLGRRKLLNSLLPALEFDVNTGFDRETGDKYRVPESELVAREAELYLLINFGGVPQTDDDRARATRITEGA